MTDIVVIGNGPSVLERRVGERDQLLVLAKGIHLPEAFIEIMHRHHRLHALADVFQIRCRL